MAAAAGSQRARLPRCAIWRVFLRPPGGRSGPRRPRRARPEPRSPGPAGAATVPPGPGRNGQQVPVGESVPYPDDQADAERVDRPAAAAPPAASPGTGRRAGCCSGRRADQDGQPEGQPSQGRQHPILVRRGCRRHRRGRGRVALTSRESTSMHSPPKRSTCARGSLYALRLVYAGAGADRQDSRRPGRSSAAGPLDLPVGQTTTRCTPRSAVWSPAWPATCRGKPTLPAPSASRS